MNESSSPSRFAAKPETLAKALGIPARGKKFKQFRAWLIGQKCKSQHGWNIADMRRKWNSQGGDLFDHDQLKKIRHHNLLKLWSQGKRLSAEEKSELQAAGLLKADDEQPVPDVGADEPAMADDLAPCDSQAALARMLARHFAGRISIDVSEQQISNWKKGVNLPDGVPLPPAKVGPRLDGRAWAEWIERSIIPKYGRHVDGQGALLKDVFQLGSESEQRKKILEEKIKEIEYLAAAGKFKPVELFNRHLATLGGAMRKYIVDHCEKNLARTAEDAVAKLELPETKREKFLSAMRDAYQRASDGILVGLSKQLRELTVDEDVK